MKNLILLVLCATMSCCTNVQKGKHRNAVADIQGDWDMCDTELFLVAHGTKSIELATLDRSDCSADRYRVTLYQKHNTRQRGAYWGTADVSMQSTSSRSQVADGQLVKGWTVKVHEEFGNESWLVLLLTPPKHLQEKGEPDLRVSFRDGFDPLK